LTVRRMAVYRGSMLPTPSSAEVGIWVAVAFGIVIGLLTVIEKWKVVNKKPVRHQRLPGTELVTRNELLELKTVIAQCVTKSEFSELKGSISQFANKTELTALKETIDKLNEYCHGQMHEIRNAVAPIVTRQAVLEKEVGTLTNELSRVVVKLDDNTAKTVETLTLVKESGKTIQAATTTSLNPGPTQS
jgi:hypothetical protein